MKSLRSLLRPLFGLVWLALYPFAAQAAPDMAREQAQVAYDRAVAQALQRQRKNEPVDLSQLKERTLAWLPYNETPKAAADIARNYFFFVDALRETDPQAARARYEEWVSHPNQDVRKMAQSKLGFLALKSGPVDWKFTAMDGREVDLAQLRGKVVLLDFWATWCVPCIEELPNVKAAYREFHGQGLEIVGVSMDRAGDREKLAAFVRRENMTWPQHYEGRKHNEGGNSVAARFGVTGIPAMFLLDREGRIASTHARGPNLEQEVERLLGL